MSALTSSSRAADILEILAARTWRRIRASEELGTPYGEESITEANTLDMRAAGVREVLVVPVSKRAEAVYGADWEWYVGNPADGWWRYAVQAKRLSPDRTYRKLRYKVRGRLQSTLLRRYAERAGAVPLYCFYNYEPTLGAGAGGCWHCPLPYAPEQLGCTLAPLDVALRFMRRGAKPAFRAIHAADAAIPWRCLLRCPGLNPDAHALRHPLASKGFEDVRRHAELPPPIAALWERHATRRHLADDQALAGVPPVGLDFGAGDLEIVPRHVVVLTTGEPG